MTALPPVNATIVQNGLSATRRAAAGAGVTIANALRLELTDASTDASIVVEFSCACTIAERKTKVTSRNVVRFADDLDILSGISMHTAVALRHPQLSRCTQTGAFGIPNLSSEMPV
jgi:hypothetical protein